MDGCVCAWLGRKGGKVYDGCEGGTGSMLGCGGGGGKLCKKILLCPFLPSSSQLRVLESSSYPINCLYFLQNDNNQVRKKDK